jgi:esterase
MTDFLLHHERVGSEQAPRVGLVLHGAFGSGQNFRGFTRKLGERCPDYQFYLVDLRGHGDSNPAPAPHTLASAAEDLERLAAVLSASGPQVNVVIGHSLGGKVALELARRDVLRLEQVWALDSNPGMQEPHEAHEIQKVVRAVRGVPEPIVSRQALVDALTGVGLSSGLAQWMTTNLRRSGEQYRWAFDLDAVLALLQDYFQRDLWPYILAPKQHPELHLVVAERSDRWSDGMRERVNSLPAAASVSVHALPNSGHWVHVDNPAGLLQFLETGLRRTLAV